MSLSFRALTAVQGYVAPAAPVAISFRAAAKQVANSTSASLTLPGTIEQGDVMVLVVGWSIASAQTLTSPTGWTQIGTQVSDESQVASSAFYRVAHSGDAGSSVTIAISASGNIAAVVSAYINVDNTTPFDASASVAEGATNTTTHVTPTITTTLATDWLVSAVVDKGKPTTTTVWTPPAGDTLRQAGYNAGSTGVTAAMSDTTSTVATGTEGGKTWTSDQTTSRGVMWSFGLKASATATSGGTGGGGSQSLLIGAASDDWSTLLAQSGNMQIARLYDSGFSTNAATTNFGGKSVANHWADGRTVCYSFKPNLALLAAQDATTLANLETLLDSAAGQPMWWSIWHEPENDTIGVAKSSNTFSISDYVTGWQVFANHVHARNEPQWQTIWIMMAFTWQKSFLTPNPSFNPNSWYPGTSYVDIVGIDSYNEGSLHSAPGDGTPQRWDSPGVGYGAPSTNESSGPQGGGYFSPPLLQWLANNGKNYAVCEFGSIRNHETAMGRAKTDTSTGPYTLDWWTATYGGNSSKASWIADFAKYHAVTVPTLFSTQCVAMMYFDTSGRTWKGDNSESWQLDYTPGNVDYAAWGQALTDYGS